MKSKRKLLNKPISNYNKKRRKEMNLKEFLERWSNEWCKVVTHSKKKRKKKHMNKDCCRFNWMKKNKSKYKSWKKKKYKNNFSWKKMLSMPTLMKSSLMEEKSLRNLEPN